MTDGDHATQTRIAKLEQAVSSLRRKLDRMFTAVEQSGMNHVEFGERVSKICPAQQATQHLAEAIVTRLAQDGEWDQVYQHLRLSGMNLSDIREARGY